MFETTQRGDIRRRTILRMGRKRGCRRYVMVASCRNRGKRPTFCGVFYTREGMGRRGSYRPKDFFGSVLTGRGVPNFFVQSFSKVKKGSMLCRCRNDQWAKMHTGVTDSSLVHFHREVATRVLSSQRTY